MGALTELLLIRRFQSSSRLILTVVSIGLAQVYGPLLELTVQRRIHFASLVGAFKPPIDVSFTVDHTQFGGDHLLVVLAAPLVIIGLALVPAAHRRRHRSAGVSGERRPGSPARHPCAPPGHHRVGDRRWPGCPLVHAHRAVRGREARRGRQRTHRAAAAARHCGGRRHGVVAEGLRRRHRPRRHGGDRSLELDRSAFGHLPRLPGGDHRRPPRSARQALPRRRVGWLVVDHHRRRATDPTRAALVPRGPLRQGGPARVGRAGVRLPAQGLVDQQPGPRRRSQ